MNTRLSKHLLALGIATALLATGGCATAPDVRTDYDRSANFAQYKTFGFANPLGTDRSGFKAIVSQTLKASTQRELEARGMRLDNSAPQLLVNFNAKLTEKMQQVTASAALPMMGMGANPGPGVGYYGYREGMYSNYPNYPTSGMVTSSSVTEGTLNIDVVDAASRQLIWEGVVTNAISEKAADNPQPVIEAAVTAAFAKFPVPAKAP